MRGRRTPAIASSPVLVGAVTLLVTIVAVFLAYNANQGLPFVPTYRLNAELPSGSGLVRGNEVRVGGHRVGAVAEIRTKRVEVEGRPQAIAEIQMELEGSLEELPADTELLVRPRSALGLKYVELEPGESTRTLPAGSTVPLANADEPVELEDVLSTFDADTRVASRASLEGYGDAFAGRGEDLNRTIAALRPVVVHLEPVMRVLSDPDTQLDELFRQIGRSAAQVAPVAELQARLFGDMARTFAALVRNPDALRATIERSPETLDAAISSFRVQQPFLADFAALSRELGPAARELPRSLPAVNVALRAGQPALAGAPRTNALVGAVLGEVRELAAEPTTLLALRDLDDLLDAGAPLVSFVAPYQTVCNYWNYFWGPLGEHISEPVPNGTIERVQLVTTNETQDDRVGTPTADRFADVPEGQDPQQAEATDGSPLTRLATQFYGPAIDAQGNADCQAGQTGYPDGPLNTTGRYPPSPDPERNGGSHVMLDPNTPGNRGGTDVSRRLGIDHLEDVP
jgi:virulence factor Mce-like protein